MLGQRLSGLPLILGARRHNPSSSANPRKSPVKIGQPWWDFFGWLAAA
ncbi:MAG: hypothetical protein AB4050_18820 [Synechococcus sp.]